MRAFFSDVARRNLEFRQAGVKFSCLPVPYRFLTAYLFPQPMHLARAEPDSETEVSNEELCKNFSWRTK